MRQGNGRRQAEAIVLVDTSAASKVEEWIITHLSLHLSLSYSTLGDDLHYSTI